MYSFRFLSLRSNKAKDYALKSFKRNNSSTSVKKAEQRIEIPDRIQRSSTDILYALAGTVGRDPTAAHYKYHDDPYLIPVSNASKRVYAMAQESGRKAAQWIKEEHRDLFKHQEAAPPISAFAPKLLCTEESEVNEEILNQLILESEVKDAISVYNILKEKNSTISDETKQSLLELLCFYNNEEPMPEEWIEERWFKQNNEIKERRSKTWKSGELAEHLFQEISPKTSESYCAMIRGLSKYNQAERAFALLQEALEKKFTLDVGTYNAVIDVVNFHKETAEQRWDVAQDLLKQMASQSIKPNIGTLNSLLNCISSFSNFKFARNCALRALAEFKKIGIEPSLGSYYYLLIIFCRDRAPVSHVIVDILNEISGKEFTIQHPKDTYFFATAMDVCRNHLHDKTLAKRVNAVLHTGNNYNLIGDTYKEAVYYRHYLALLCQTETIEEFMQTYDLLVPNIYTPEPGIMEEILKAVDFNGAYHLMPRLWSDMVIFDHINRQSLVQRTVSILVASKPNIDLPSEKDLPQQFGNVAFEVFEKILNSESRGRNLSLNGKIIGDILTLLVRANDFQKASIVFNHIDKNQHKITGTPNETSLLEFVEACISNKSPSLASQCLEYICENHMDSSQIAEKIRKGFTLNETHLAKIKSLIGE